MYVMWKYTKILIVLKLREYTLCEQSKWEGIDIYDDGRWLCSAFILPAVLKRCVRCPYIIVLYVTFSYMVSVKVVRDGMYSNRVQSHFTR